MTPNSKQLQIEPIICRKVSKYSIVQDVINGVVVDVMYLPQISGSYLKTYQEAIFRKSASRKHVNKEVFP